MSTLNKQNGNIMKIKFLLSVLAVVFMPFCISASSEYCRTLVDPSGAGALSGSEDAAYFAWETNAQGEIVVTIAQSGGNDASFRAAGGGTMNLDAMTVNGNPGTDYFTKIVELPYTVRFIPAEGVTIPTEAAIHYEGIVEMRAMADGNLWPTLTFDYTYGTNCNDVIVAPLAAPSNLEIDANKVLVFTSDNATSFNIVSVYLDENLIFIQSDFNSGDILDFPSIAGSYVVKIQSIADDPAHSDSGLSVPYTWQLQGGQDTPVGKSEYCNVYVDPEGGGAAEGDADALYFTWTTTNDGSIVITTTEYNGNGMSFRAAGGGTLSLNSLTVGGALSVPFFDKTVDLSESKVTLTPKEGIVIPKGTIIKYNGIVELWGTDENLKNLYPTLAFEYTYGAVCEGNPNAIYNIQKTPFSVYFSSKDMIVIDGLDARVEVKILDLLGKVVDIQLTNSEIKISDLSNGVYLLSIKGQTIKFVK